MPCAFSAGDAAIQRSNANAQSVCATGGSSGSGAATVSTRQAKIDASRGARQTRSIAPGLLQETRYLRRQARRIMTRLTAPRIAANTNGHDEPSPSPPGEVRGVSGLSVVVV